MDTLRFEIRKPVLIAIVMTVFLLIYIIAGVAYTQFLTREIASKRQELAYVLNTLVQQIDAKKQDLASTMEALGRTVGYLQTAQQQLSATQNQLDRIRQLLNTTPMPIVLENQSSGTTYFYADGGEVCVNRCVIALQPGTKQHTLAAFTYYGDSQPYVTPQTYVSFTPGSIRRYLACGMTGSPGSNCGFL